MEDYKGKDFLGNPIKNGDFAVISRYSTLYPVVVTENGENSDYARFVYINDYNKGCAEMGKRLTGGVLFTKNFIRCDVELLSKDVKGQFEIIKRRIKTID